MKPIEAAVPEEDLDEAAKARVDELLASPQDDHDADTIDDELEEPE